MCMAMASLLTLVISFLNWPCGHWLEKGDGLVSPELPGTLAEESGEDGLAHVGVRTKDLVYSLRAPQERGYGWW